MLSRQGLTIGLAVLAASATIGSAQAADSITLEYWVYSDYAQGDALQMQQTFIEEFQKTHPNVTINISGKGDDALTGGQIAGAASGTLPDVFMNGVDVGATLVDAGALKNIYPEWMAMPQEFRDQFDPDAISVCQPAPETMYCIPYTGYATFMYRNLTVLKAAGIDPSQPIKDWADWLSQMEKIKAAGKYAVPDQTQTWQSVVATYSGIATSADWGANFDTKTTKVDPAKYAKALQLLKDMAPYNSGTSRNDQATKDLFISNELAFHIVGPWVNPTYEEAAKQSGLEYDYVLAPGATESQHGGIKGYEFIGVAPNAHADVAFEFAAYVSAKEQMVRWEKLLSRFNANAAAMADPQAAELPLVKITEDAAKDALFNMPPYFSGAYPNCYRQILTDNAAEVVDSDMDPAEGAKSLVEQLNACLSEG